jgi:hypothetical protein
MSDQTSQTVRDARVKFWARELFRFTIGYPLLTEDEIMAKVGEVEGPEAAVDARVQKAILLEIKARLDADPGHNQRYIAQPDWKILHQLLTAARIKELTRAKISKRARSKKLGYDVSELARTFYGRQVLDGMGFSRTKHVLDSDEFLKLQAEFQKVKLTLPEAIEPTYTEKFFAGEDS